MTKEEPFAYNNKDSKDSQNQAAISAGEDTSNWVRICPNCGKYNPKYLESCSDCDYALGPKGVTDVKVPCPTCNGQGTIYLEYLDDCATEHRDQEDRWLPCGDCDGTGEVPKSMIIERQNKMLLDHVLKILSGLLPKLGR